MVNRYARKAGLERKFHPHACRHTFGFKLGRKGIPIQIIKKLMGQSKIEKTSSRAFIRGEKLVSGNTRLGQDRPQGRALEASTGNFGIRPIFLSRR